MKSVFAALALACAPAFAFAVGGTVVLSGHVARRTLTAAPLGHAAASENVDLSLVVRFDQALMDRTLASLYGPGSPTNKRFLMPSEFAATFDLAMKRQALKDFARASGLSVSADDNPNSQIVKVSGPVSLVERAFAVRLNHYRSAAGQIFRANDGDPSIPSALAPHLRAILGLSNYRGAANPHVRRSNPAARAAAPRGVAGSGPGGGLSPANIKSIYHLTSGLTGTGQRLALVEFDGYAPSDVGLYEKQFFAAPYSTVAFVSVDGQANLCGSSQSQPCNASTLSLDSGMNESALDIDMALALSSGAAGIDVYTAPNTNTGTVDVYNAIATAGTAKSVSTSWGEDEADAGTALMGSENSIFQRMAAQGQSIFSAAGDFGAYDAAQMTNTSGGYQTWVNQLLTDDPASQPYVTGVGGTSLSGTIGGAVTETVWNNGCFDANNNYLGATCSPAQLSAGGYQEAGGGGVASYVSGYWPLPSYQSGVSGTASQTYRNVPDVALNADPNAAPYTVCVGGNCSSLIGGTSAAAPLWAALTTLINEQRLAGGYTTLGFANPSLYALAGNSASYGSDFNDIPSGGGGNGYYAAGTGYDNASGWGSFKADALITQLSAPPTLLAQPFAALSTSSFTASFTESGNPPGTIYVVQASTNASFAPLVQTSTTGLTASLSGLLSNSLYYVHVAARNPSGTLTSFSTSKTTATLVAVPAPGATPSGASPSALEVRWSTAGFAAATSYSASVSLSASPFSSVSSAGAVGSAAVVSGLAANTTYYAQVAAQSLSSDPNGAPGLVGAGSTLAVPVTGAAIQQVFVSTMIVGWTPTSGNEGFRVELSTTPTFAVLSASAFAPATASSALVSGLFYDTTYYARVGTLNWQGAPDYFDVAGATTTGAPAFSTGTAGTGGLVLTLPLSPPLISLTVTIPAGAFPAGTSASAIEGFFGTPLTTLSGARSNESAITPTGPQAAFCVSGASTCLYSGGPQPSAPVLFSVVYSPGQLPSGLAENALQLMRFDPVAGQWTLVASHDDASAHVLTAYTTHFSLFAPFFMTAATPGDLSPVQIFPQPWELGAPGSPYYANVLTFSNLPAGAEVKLLTLAGELVWEGSASGSGVATWDGHNRFGRAAASGTYLCSISSGGTKRLRRVVLIR